MSRRLGDAAPAWADLTLPFLNTDYVPIIRSGMVYRTSLLESYRRSTPTTGATVTVQTNDRIVILDPAAALATLTVALAAGVDKRRLKIVTRQRIDALTITPNGSDSVDWSVNELPQYGRLEFIFVGAIATWVLV